MANRAKPYETFGPYLLFKKLEESSLGDVWRASSIASGQLGPFVALHRLHGGQRDALRTSAEAARPIIPSIAGSAIVRDQTLEIIDGIPVILHEYTGGRTLRHIVDRAGKSSPPKPIPLDQALSIIDKIAFSLESLANMKYQGERLLHESLIPQFVWVVDDGETRVAGQQLGRGLIASAIRTPEAVREIGPYVAPEIRQSGKATKASDVYSVGAILYLVLTGENPPDPMNTAEFERKVAEATLITHEPIPADVRPILVQSLAIDPAKRYKSAAELRQALAPLVHGGAYSATTFNLAFYLSTLLRKEIDAEPGDRERESSVDLAVYSAAPPPPPEATSVPQFGKALHEDEPKSKMPLIAAGVIAALAAVGGIAYFTVIRKQAPAATPAPVATAAVPASTPALIEPIVESVLTPGTDTATGDEAARKAFEDAVNKKLREEMLKLQDEFNKDLAKRNPPKTADTGAAATAPTERPAAVTPPPQTQSRPVEPSPPAVAATTVAKDKPPVVASTTTSTPPPETTATPAVVPPPPVAASVVAEGDLVSIQDLDKAPKQTRQVRPVYPPLAARQKIEANVILSALIDEKGRVTDVKVLGGDKHGVGLDEAAIKAVKQWQFIPAEKNGKKVKVWYPIAVGFKLQ